MRWRGERESENVEDRRDEGGGGFGSPFPGGGGLRFPSGGGARGGGIGIVGLLILLGLMFFFGVDPRVIMQGGGPGGDESNFPDIRLPQSRPDTTGFPVPRQPQGPDLQHPRSASQDDLKQFVSVVLAETEDVWSNLLPQYGARYSDPKLVLFSGGVRSACGIGMAQMGPFYCPQDQKVYIDLSFYKELKDRFNAPGDAAQAYVIAHEVGHHVQNLLGIMDQVDAVRQRVSERQGNAIQVRVELQADCFAGVWANKAQEAKNIFEPGDIESRAQRGKRHRRRSHPEADARLRRAGFLHPRVFSSARALVQARLRDRRSAPMRHVQRRRPLGADFVRAPAPYHFAG